MPSPLAREYKAKDEGTAYECRHESLLPVRLHSAHDQKYIDVVATNQCSFVRRTSPRQVPPRVRKRDMQF